MGDPEVSIDLLETENVTEATGEHLLFWKITLWNPET